MEKPKYNRIKEVLDNKGIKQTWLANQLGKSFRQINSYTCNACQPSIPVLFEIADILNISPSDLLCDHLPSKSGGKIDLHG